MVENEIMMYDNQVLPFRQMNFWDRRGFHNYSDLNIFYVSDIHLEHHLKNFKMQDNIVVITKKLIAELDRYLKKMHTFYLKQCKKDKTIESRRMLIICGDIANNISLVDLFFERFFFHCPEFVNETFYVLGNHELSQFDTIEICCTAYKKMLEKHKVVFLHNNEYVYNNSENENPICIFYGGVGFSKYNEQHNSTNLCYSNDIFGNRTKEIMECETFYKGYLSAVKKASTYNIPLIVMSHCPTQDWILHNKLNAQCIYFYGHNHHNDFIRTEEQTVIANNQIGYENDIVLQYIGLSNMNNPFAGYEDGYYEITTEQYVDYYVYIGEYIHEPKLIKSALMKENNKFYVIKRNGYYGFFITTPKGTRICQGGMIKIISKNGNIQYFYENFQFMLDIYKNAMQPFRNIQEQISKELRYLGFSGKIHGCIVDVDYYNHIMLNPYDGMTTFYYSPSFGEAQCFSSFKQMLKSSKDISLQGEYSNMNKKKRKAITDKYNNSFEKGTNLLCMSDKELEEQIGEIEQIDISNSLYPTSRKINQVQRIFSGKLLREWNDDLILHKEDYAILAEKEKNE